MNMKPINLIAMLVFSLSTVNVGATAIVNGNFQTGDFSGWSKDTDGLGDFSSGNDFSILGSGSDFSAKIEVDHFSTPGDMFSTPVDDVFFAANTLFQELDFTTSLNNSFMLNIDFSVMSQLTSADAAFIGDSFLIGLNDGTGSYYDQNGNLGFLVAPSEIDGVFSQTLSFELDNSFANQSGWFLEFQVGLGFDDDFNTDAFGSSLLLNSVSLLDTPTAEVAAPATLLMFSFAMVGLCVGSRKRSAS